MMTATALVRHDAPGLPADWLNGWLAAIGVTVLLADTKLSWTEDVVPYAVLWTPEGMDLPLAISASLPSEDALAASPIAPDGPGGELGQRVASSGLYKARADVARQQHSDALSSSLTDLAHEFSGGGPPTPVARGQFCVGMEGGETLWKRLRKCVAAVQRSDHPNDGIARTLTGAPTRHLLAVNGLGFDPRRLPTGITHSSGVVDPIIEILAYCGTLSLPVRGSAQESSKAVQKPWLRQPDRSDRLAYPVWRPILDRWAIDAYLDQFLVNLDRRSMGTTIAAFNVRRLIPQTGTKKAAYFTEPLHD